MANVRERTGDGSDTERGAVQRAEPPEVRDSDLRAGGAGRVPASPSGAVSPQTQRPAQSPVTVPPAQRVYPRGTKAPPVRRVSDAPGLAVPEHAGRRARPERTVSEVPEVAPPLLASADDELRELYRRALWLGCRGHEPLVSFTPLFLAFLGGDTPFSDWVKATAEDMKLTPSAVLDGWRQLPNWYDNAIRPEHVRAPQAPRITSDAISDRARAVLEAGAAYQARTGAPALGARHVFAAFLLAPVGADADFEAWHLRRRSWAARLAVCAEQLAPGEDWRGICLGGDAPRPSTRLRQVLGAAELIAQRRQRESIDVEDVVRGMLACAARWRGEKIANVWLLQQLGDAALATLQVTELQPRTSSSEPPGSRQDSSIASTSAVTTWLRDAQLWALTCRYPELNLRHVVAALLSPRGPAAGRRMLRRAGRDPGQLAGEFARLIREVEPDEDHATWQWLLDNDVPHHDVARPGYANDVARGVDLLSLGTEVRALASVLASLDTRPPLSVGLFGNWGSGKSFFMEMLRDHIRLLAERSHGAQESAYCSEIAQIEFNAWHYLDGDLWASLVSHVLDSLETYFRGDAQSTAEQARCELATNQLKLAEIEKQQRALDQRRELFESEVRAYTPSSAEVLDEASAEIAEVVKQRTAEADPEVRKALDDVARRIGVPPGELSLGAVRQHALAVRAWWKQTTPRSLAIGALFIAIAAIGALAVAWYNDAAQWAIAALTPAIPVIARIIQVGRPIAKAARQATEIGQKVTDRIARSRPSAFRERQQIEAAQAALTAERKQLDDRAEVLRTRLTTVKAPGMRDYVLDRAGQYRDRLGIVASVHRDFRNLSDQLRDDTTDPKLQRIILYIDDLDRCPPTRVVEMLQAIHLLLSFELFVVVVAVDPTWLTRSLEAYYARQFNGCTTSSHDREARPQFYLEKIFQIPYALRPMSARRFGNMVDALLEPALVHDVVPSPTTVNASGPARAIHGGGTPDGSRVSLPVADAAPAIDLMPCNLQITPAELAHLRTLGPLVSSPRATKRLTNLYRIVRAGLVGDALDEFVDSGYPLTQTLLAAVVGCPEVVVEWFQQILGMASGDLAQLLAPLDKLAATGPQAQFLCDRVRACLEQPVGGCAPGWQRTMDICRLAARYSFETGALLELVPA